MLLPLIFEFCYANVILRFRKGCICGWCTCITFYFPENINTILFCQYDGVWLRFDFLFDVFRSIIHVSHVLGLTKVSLCTFSLLRLSCLVFFAGGKWKGFHAANCVAQCLIYMPLTSRQKLKVLIFVTQLVKNLGSFKVL